MLDLNEAPKTEEVTYKGKTVRVSSDVPVRHFQAILSLDQNSKTAADDMRKVLSGYLSECNDPKKAVEFVDSLPLKGIIRVVTKIAEVIRDDTNDIKKKMEPIEPSEDSGCSTGP